MRNPVWPSSYVTPAGTSIDAQNEWEENTHINTPPATAVLTVPPIQISVDGRHTFDLLLELYWYVYVLYYYTAAGDCTKSQKCIRTLFIDNNVDSGATNNLMSTLNHHKRNTVS